MRLPPILHLAVRTLLLSLFAAALLLVLAGVARGEEPDEPATVRLVTDEAAPHDGVLLTEARLDRVTERLIAGEECRGRLEASERVRASLAEDLADAESRAARPTAAEGGSAWPWVVVGYAAGVVTAGLVIWGAVRILESGR